MNKPKRNDPCPCGSGKKYKKCCGSSNAIEISPEIYNMELEELHSEVIRFAFQEYNDELAEITAKYPHPFPKDARETIEVYEVGLTFWAIMNVPILPNNQTIFDIFYNKNESKMKRTRTKNTFAEWSHSKPSVYDILSVDKTEQQIKIADVFTEEVHAIPFVEENDDFQAGNLAIGILVPYVELHHFFLTALEMFEDSKHDIIDLAKTFTAREGGLNANFPQFLADVLLLGFKVAEWSNPVQKMVTALFSKNMEEKGINVELINSGNALWNTYCKLENPAIKKPNSYAAALEYYIHKSYIDEPATQSQLAKEYNTTASTVSTNYRKLEKALSQELVKL